MAREPQAGSVSHDCCTTRPNPTFSGFRVFLLFNLLIIFVAGAVRHWRHISLRQMSVRSVSTARLPVAGALLLPRTSSKRSQPNPQERASLASAPKAMHPQRAIVTSGIASVAGLYLKSLTTLMKGWDNVKVKKPLRKAVNAYKRLSVLEKKRILTDAGCYTFAMPAVDVHEGHAEDETMNEVISESEDVIGRMSLMSRTVGVSG